MNWEINFCFRYLHFSDLFQTGRWRVFSSNKKKTLTIWNYFVKNPNLRIRHVNINMRLTDGLSGAVFNVLVFKNFLLRISMCHCIKFIYLRTIIPWLKLTKRFTPFLGRTICQVWKLTSGFSKGRSPQMYRTARF